MNADSVKVLYFGALVAFLVALGVHSPAAAFELQIEELPRLLLAQQTQDAAAEQSETPRGEVPAQAEKDEKVKPGMTAEASFFIKDENRMPGYMVPFQALLPATEANRGFAFVYDPDTSTVKKTAVHARGTEQKKAIVDEGLAEGDIIAVAGGSFLADGMKVKLMEQ